MNKKEINIVIAMKSEAKPLINYWKLKKINNTSGIYTDKKKK